MNSTEDTDEALGLRVAMHAPDSEAHAPFQELYCRLAEPSERFIAARIGRSSVQDIHQKTWSKAWSSAHQFTNGTRYRAWLITIARNTILDEYRASTRKSAQPLLDDQMVVDGGQSVDRCLIDSEERDALEKCLQQLDATSVELVRGRLSGTGYDRLCELLHLSEAAAHKLFFNAKSRLQHCIQAKIS